MQKLVAPFPLFRYHTLMAFSVIFVLYSLAILWAVIKCDSVRYRLLFGYVFGVLCGALTLLMADMGIAIMTAVAMGLVGTAKVMMSPNR